MQKQAKKFIEKLVEVAEHYKRENPNSFWDKVLEDMKKLYPNKYMTKDSLRWLYRTADTKNKVEPQRAHFKDTLEGLDTLEERLLSRLKRKVELSAIAHLLRASEDEILASVAKLQLNGYSGVKIWKEGGKTFIQHLKKTKEQKRDFIRPWDNSVRTIKIAIIGDTHYGSKYALEEELEAAYDHFKAEGITEVYHGGDLTEGFKQARMHTFMGNKAIGFSDQLEYTVKNYPKREGITTYVISGNHDLFFMQDSMAHIVKAVVAQRDDMVFLGDEFARVWLTPKVDLGLVHPDDGVSANPFTKLYNYVERAGQKLCRIQTIHHYHKNAHIHHRGVDAFFVPSFQLQSKWMNTKNLRSDLGYLILTIKVDKEGNLISTLPEMVMLNDIYYNQNYE